LANLLSVNIYRLYNVILILAYLLDWGVYRPLSHTIPIFNMTTPSSTQLSLSVNNPRTSISVLPPTSSLDESAYLQDIPPRLVKKILNLEYVEMAELLLEYWELAESKSCCCGSQSTERPCNRYSSLVRWLFLFGFSILHSVPTQVSTFYGISMHHH